MSTTNPTTTTTVVHPTRGGAYMVSLPETAVWRDADEIDLLARVVIERTHSLLRWVRGTVELAVQIEDSAISIGATSSTATRTFSVGTDGEVYRVTWMDAGYRSEISIDVATCIIDVQQSTSLPPWTTEYTELPEDEVWSAIQQLLPDARFGADEDGYLTVHTGLLYCGYDGEELIGRIVLP